jgi:signal peptidase I
MNIFEKKPEQCESVDSLHNHHVNNDKNSHIAPAQFEPSYVRNNVTSKPAKDLLPQKPVTEFAQIRSFVKTVLIIVFTAILIRGSLIEAFKIPSGSMIPTLKIGDRILVSKLTYGLRLPFFQKILYQYASPKRGEIVVFTRPDDPNTPENESETNIIKRVVGIEGDKVEVKGTRVFVNNIELKESYARWEDGGSREGNYGPDTVPKGHLFMLGDNRDRSKDSRLWEGGHYLPVENVKGRALIIFWSSDSLSRIGTIIQ